MAKPKDDFRRMRAIAEESGQIFTGRRVGNHYRAKRVAVDENDRVIFSETRTVSVFYPVYEVVSTVFRIAIFLAVATGAVWLLGQIFA